jgi:hypothetical protein
VKHPYPEEAMRPPSTDPSIPIAISLPKSMVDALQAKREQTGMPVSASIRKALEQAAT